MGRGVPMPIARYAVDLLGNEGFTCERLRVEIAKVQSAP